MEKVVVHGKKEARTQIADAMRQAIQNLGISKLAKKSKKAVAKSSKKIATLVEKQIKKERKSLAKQKHKTKKKKSHSVAALATA